jgi:Transposase and inactivated derivatives
VRSSAPPPRRRGAQCSAPAEHPDYRSIARFRARHLEALSGLFVQALRLCAEAGLVKLGRLALDGTKLRANASRHKAMSYERMTKAESELEAEIAELRARARALLEEAAATDAAEDELYGADRRGDELPAELARRESRLEAPWVCWRLVYLHGTLLSRPASAPPVSAGWPASTGPKGRYWSLKFRSYSAGGTSPSSSCSRSSL